MFVALYNSSGGLVQTGFANEDGLNFTGLNPSVLYYVQADSCDFCHGSTHNVTFTYWDNSNITTNPIQVAIGSSPNAWYTYVPMNSTTTSGDSPIILTSAYTSSSSTGFATGNSNYMTAKTSFTEA
jgi:hypothetical protein